jgi:hypothetical protein
VSAVQRPTRAPRSLRSEYEEFIEQRIEEYKDGLPRASILGIGDEAVQELTRSEQYQLTEVLLQEQVDSIIRRRLRLPSYRRWRERHLALPVAEPGAVLGVITADGLARVPPADRHRVRAREAMGSKMPTA